MRCGHREQGGAPRRGEGRPGEEGETLVELLVTVAIMSIGIIGVLLAIANAVIITDRVSNGSRANVVAHDQAELVKDPVTLAPYVLCATTADYPSAADFDATLPDGWTAEITEIRYWDGDATGDEITWFDDRTACQVAGDKGLQQMVIRVESPAERRVAKEVVVVKRDRGCPAAAPEGVFPC